MKIEINNNFYDVHQRVIFNAGGVVKWRVGFTTDKPLMIRHSDIVGLAMQLDLSQAGVMAALGTAAFPPQLLGPDEAPRPVDTAQWAYKPAIAALLTLAKANRSAG